MNEIIPRDFFIKSFASFFLGIFALILEFFLWRFVFWKLVGLFTEPEVNLLTGAITSFTDEFLKFILVVMAIPLFGFKIIHIPFMGIGFGFAEGISTLINQPLVEKVYILPWLHLIFALVMAFFFYLGIREGALKKYLYYGLALIIPFLIHFSYYYIFSSYLWL